MKNIVIIGASRGIGRSLTHQLSRTNRVLALSRNLARLEELKDLTLAENLKVAAGDLSAPNLKEYLTTVFNQELGKIDILINNASAISLTPTLETEMKRYDLMHSVNTRGTFMVSKACIPHLLKSDNPHVLNISPPLNMEAKWFGPHVAYTMAKFGMSMCVLGMAKEFKKQGIAFNALWPRTTIATAAIKNLLGGETAMRGSRKPDIMADAAHIILTRDAKVHSSNFYIDDEVLASEGIKDLSAYAVDPNATLLPDFFVDPV